jgi:predicted ATPase
LLLLGLEQLVHAEILYQRGLPPQTQYRFKHALIQEAAYQSLLRHTRQQYHSQIAQALETRFPEMREAQSELLAHHYTEAGLTAQAVAYWQYAGQRAIARSAYREAIAHLRRGLALIASLPATPARLQHALTLYLALGTRDGAYGHPGLCCP